MWKGTFAMLPALVAVFAVSLSPAQVAENAEQILMASQDYVAARSVEIQQTMEQTARVLVDGKPSVDSQTTKQTSVIEIDSGNKLIRLTTKDQGKDLVVIRKGKNIVMKIGSGPWAKPQGPYARIGDQLANPFACPLPKDGDKNSPKWKVVGIEQIDGREAIVVETTGDTANKYAQERMREGIGSFFPDASARPTVEVMAYKSRHWIGKDDHRRLRVEQTSHQKMTMPSASKTIIDISAKTTAVYNRYDKIEIQVPEEARGLLNSN